MDLYSKYGGYDFFHQAIYDLYLELFDHPEIAYHFIGVNMIELSHLQASYLCQHIGGPANIYKGRSIQSVHRNMKITPFEFDIVAKRFQKIFEEKGLEPVEVKFIVDFVASKAPSIITAKSVLIDRIMSPIYKIIYRIRKIFS